MSHEDTKARGEREGRATSLGFGEGRAFLLVPFLWFACAASPADEVVEHEGAGGQGSTPEAVGAPVGPPARLVSFGEPPALPDEPTREQARSWLEAEQICVVREERLSAWSTAPTVDARALAAAWSVLARAPADAQRDADRVLATCAVARAADFPPDVRRSFLEASALARNPLETLPPRPLVDLLVWVGRAQAVDAEAAMVAHLEVMEPREVQDLLEQAGIIRVEAGEWDVVEAELARLSDPLLVAIEAAAEAGHVGPRSDLTRALARQRARR